MMLQGSGYRRLESSHSSVPWAPWSPAVVSIKYSPICPAQSHRLLASCTRTISTAATCGLRHDGTPSASSSEYSVGTLADARVTKTAVWPHHSRTPRPLLPGDALNCRGHPKQRPERSMGCHRRRLRRQPGQEIGMTKVAISTECRCPVCQLVHQNTSVPRHPPAYSLSQTAASSCIDSVSSVKIATAALCSATGVEHPVTATSKNRRADTRQPAQQHGIRLYENQN